MLHKSSPMGQWNICQGLGALFQVRGPAVCSFPVSPGQVLRYLLPCLSQQPLCCLHCQRGLVCGQIGLGMNPMHPVVGWGCEVSVLPGEGNSKSHVLRQLAKARRKLFASFVTKRSPFSFCTVSWQLYSRPCLLHTHYPVSLFLSGCFLLRRVDRIKTTSYFPCPTPHPRPPMDLSAFMGFSLIGSTPEAQGLQRHFLTKAVVLSSPEDNASTWVCWIFIFLPVIQGNIIQKISVMIVMSYTYFYYSLYRLAT